MYLSNILNGFSTVSSYTPNILVGMEGGNNTISEVAGNKNQLHENTESTLFPKEVNAFYYEISIVPLREMYPTFFSSQHSF